MGLMLGGVEIRDEKKKRNHRVLYPSVKMVEYRVRL